MAEQISIDGRMGEGGGQVLRTALALATLLGRPLSITGIRQGRRRPGLRPQHLAAVRALARISSAQVTGARENATELTFCPGPLKGGDYRFAIGTAGSVTLLASALLPPLLFAGAPSTVVLEGGTHVPYSPVFHYFAEIFLPMVRRMGAEVEARLARWGWYPAGGGSCTLRITPCQGLLPLQCDERGRLRQLTLILGLAGLPLHIIDREEERLRGHLEGVGYSLQRRFEPAPSPGQGNVLFLKAAYEQAVAGFSALGRKGRPAEQVADDLARQFVDFAEAGAVVDKHLADQLVLYLALAGGTSLVRTEELTSHLVTNMAVIEKFLPVRFKVDADRCLVRVSGTGHRGGGEEGS